MIHRVRSQSAGVGVVELRLVWCLGLSWYRRGIPYVKLRANFSACIRTRSTMVGGSTVAGLEDHCAQVSWSPSRNQSHGSKGQGKYWEYTERCSGSDTCRSMKASLLFIGTSMMQAEDNLQNSHRRCRRLLTGNYRGHELERRKECQFSCNKDRHFLMGYALKMQAHESNTSNLIGNNSSILVLRRTYWRRNVCKDTCL